MLDLGRDITSITEAVLTGHCVMGKHAEKMALPFNDFYRGCRSAEEEKVVMHFLHQCPSLTRCRYRLFVSSFLRSLTELSSNDIKDIASYMKLSGFSSVG